MESEDEVRECDIRGAGTGRTVGLPEDETMRERGEMGGDPDPDPVLPVEKEGDIERFGGLIVRAALVAWWRSVGGAFAIAFAFALLAAIAAATELFFGAVAVGAAVLVSG